MSYNLTLFQPQNNWISGNETDFLSYEGFLIWSQNTPQVVTQSVNFTWESSDRVIININVAKIPNPFATTLIAVNYKGVNFWFDVVDFKPLTQEILQVTGTLNIYYSFLMKEFKENNSSDQRIAFFIKKHCNRCSNNSSNIVKNPWLFKIPKELEPLNTLDVLYQQINIQNVSEPISQRAKVPVYDENGNLLNVFVDATLNAVWNTENTRIIGYMYAVVKQSPNYTSNVVSNLPPYALAPIVYNPYVLSAKYFLSLSDVNSLGSNVLEIVMLPFSMIDLSAGINSTVNTVDYWTYTNLKPSNFPTISTKGNLYVFPYNYQLKTFPNDAYVFNTLIMSAFTGTNFQPNLAQFEPLINQVTQKIEISNGVDTIDLDLQNVSNYNPPLTLPTWELNVNFPQFSYYMSKQTILDWYVQYHYLNSVSTNINVPQMIHKSFYTEIALPSLSTNWGDYIQQHQIAYNNSKILAILGLATSPIGALKSTIATGINPLGQLGNLSTIGTNLASESVNLHYLESGMRKDESRTGTLRQNIEKNAFVNGGVLLSYTIKKTNPFNQNAIFKHIALFGYEYGNYTLFRAWYNRKIFNWVQMDYVIKDLGINANKTYASEIAGMLKRGIRIWTRQSVLNNLWGSGLTPQTIYENMEVSLNEPEVSD